MSNRRAEFVREKKEKEKGRKREVRNYRKVEKY